jgi:hypothetical protein
MAGPAAQNLTVTRGDTLTLVVVMTTDGVTALNVSTRTYAAQVRKSVDAALASATFTCTVTDGPNGEVTCALPASATALLSPGGYVWDLQESAGSAVATVLSGSVTVVADVTR